MTPPASTRTRPLTVKTKGAFLVDDLVGREPRNGLPPRPEGHDLDRALKVVAPVRAEEEAVAADHGDEPSVLVLFVTDPFLAGRRSGLRAGARPRRGRARARAVRRGGRSAPRPERRATAAAANTASLAGPDALWALIVSDLQVFDGQVGLLFAEVFRGHEREGQADPAAAVQDVPPIGLVPAEGFEDAAVLPGQELQVLALEDAGAR